MEYKSQKKETDMLCPRYASDAVKSAYDSLRELVKAGTSTKEGIYLLFDYVMKSDVSEIAEAASADALCEIVEREMQNANELTSSHILSFPEIGKILAEAACKSSEHCINTTYEDFSGVSENEPNEPSIDIYRRSPVSRKWADIADKYSRVIDDFCTGKEDMMKTCFASEYLHSHLISNVSDLSRKIDCAIGINELNYYNNSMNYVLSKLDAQDIMPEEYSVILNEISTAEASLKNIPPIIAMLEGLDLSKERKKIEIAKKSFAV